MKLYQEIATAVTGLLLALAAIPPKPADAALLTSYQITGNVDWSIDGVGSNKTPVGSLSANVPTGSTIEKAFLYSSRYDSGSLSNPSVTFDGISYSGSTWTPLGNEGNFLQAFRTDVTSQVATKVGSGSGTFSFTVDETGGTNVTTDGEVLAIVYSNPTKPLSTIAFLDGAQSFSGGTFKINYATPLDTTVPGFQELLSLGIGFSAQVNNTSQYSTVDVNGRRLTSAAGGEDDGTADENGGLITVGGLGDSPANPSDPFARPTTDPRLDDELYNLALGNSANSTPFVRNGDTSTTVFTQNPSRDDLLFFAGVNVTAEANVTPVPEPSSPLAPLAFGALSASYMLKRQLKKRKVVNA